ncbi:MAG TPA: hypothetical protein VIO64_22135 [Pseudobacteroides sp.]
MPGFLSSTGAWNWNADANQRAVLNRLIERGKAAALQWLHSKK